MSCNFVFLCRKNFLSEQKSTLFLNSPRIRLVLVKDCDGLYVGLMCGGLAGHVGRCKVTHPHAR